MVIITILRLELTSGMKRFIKWGLQVSIVFYTIVHFVTSFYENELLITSLAISGLFLFFFALFYITAAKFKLPLFIFTIGIIILLHSRSSITDSLLTGAIQMRSMIGLLVIVPLISSVLREEPYIEDIMSVFYKFVHTSRKFYFTLVTFTQIIAYFLLFGSITMMYQFINIILKDQKSEAWEHYKGTALLRGFGLSTLWVVSIPSFIFAVETLGASLWIAMIQGFVIAMIGTLISVSFSNRQMKKYKLDVTPVLQTEIENVLQFASSKDVQVKKVIEFFLLFISLFGTIFLLHGFFKIKLMLLIPIVIIFWMLAFYLYKGKKRKFFFVIQDYVKNDMVNQTYQLSVMIVVGILIFGLNQTDFATIVIGGLNYLQHKLPFINFLYLLPFLIILLGFLGLGPLTVMVLVAGILENLALPYPPELMVLAITSGSVISIVISPIVMPVIILSASNGLSLFTNGFKFNWKFAITFYIVVQFYIQTMLYFR